MELLNRYQKVINQQLLQETPHSVLWAIIVRLLRNAGFDFAQIDQAVIDTWAELYKDEIVTQTPPVVEVWWNARDERSVEYAANIWGTQLEDAWEVIDLAVRAELLNETLPEQEFKTWADMKSKLWRKMADDIRKKARQNKMD